MRHFVIKLFFTGNSMMNSGNSVSYLLDCILLWIISDLTDIVTNSAVDNCLCVSYRRQTAVRSG